MSEEKTKGNVNAALTYVAGWITGLIFLLVEKKDEFVRFHAAQSLTVFGGLMIITFVPILGQVLALILWPLSIALWVILIIKAYQGEKFKLPIVGDLAEKVKDKIGK